VGWRELTDESLASPIAHTGRDSCQSACDTGLQVEDHGPKAIDFAAFDDFERLEAVEGRGWGVEAGRDRVGRYGLGEAVTKTVELFDALQNRLAHWFAAVPVGDRALGGAGVAGEDLAAESEATASLADGRWRNGVECA
jgi:hypothetical protein